MVWKYELSQNTVNGDIKHVLMAYETHFKSLNAILSYITAKEYQNLPQIWYFYQKKAKNWGKKDVFLQARENFLTSAREKIFFPETR